MTDTTPVGRICSLLELAGFRRLPTPLVVGGLKFEFPAALVPNESFADLVLVVDSIYEEDTRLVRKVEAVARALDISRSTRSLTLVIAGPRPKANTIDALTAVCRVLATGTILNSDVESRLENWLAVLLPLELPQSSGTAADPLGQLESVASEIGSPTAALIAAAPQGIAVVRSTLYRAIDDATGESESV